jgi:hypothetical protein
MHLPLRLSETDSIAVKVLLILASQVFLLLSTIGYDFSNTLQQLFSGTPLKSGSLPHYIIPAGQML